MAGSSSTSRHRSHPTAGHSELDGIGQILTTSSQRGDRRMDVDFSDFKKPLVMGGVIASLIAGAALMLVTQMYRLPDLDRREEQQNKALDAKFAEMSANMDKQFTAMHNDVNVMDGRVQDRLK